MQAIVKEKFESYPENIQKRMQQLRKIILDTAKEEDINEVEETLKWHEPSYLVKGGSTIRIDWKSKHPNQIAIYFDCKTLLIETFKEVHGGLFNYQGKRAIVFQLSEPLPTLELKHCISMALRYHNIKHLPLLGA